MTTLTARNDAFRNCSASALILLIASTTCAPLPAAERIASVLDLKGLDFEDLMNIEVTSVTRRPERLAEAASAIQVITASDIRRSGATTIPEALRLAGNLHVAKRGSSGWAISARGFNTDLANKLLVMIDGRTVYTPLFSGVYWQAQDYLLEDIERIEVISGPGGTLWGANAVNGVINIITRSAADTTGLHAEAGAGTETESHMAMRFGGTSSPDVHFRAYGKHFSRESSVLADGSSAGDPSRKSQGGFRVDSTASAGNLFTVQGDAYRLRERDPDAGITTMRGANVLGRWTRDVATDSSWTLQAYYDWTEIAEAVPALVLNGTQFADAGELNDDLKTLDLDFQHGFQLGDAQRIVWGAAFRNLQDVVSNAPALAFLPARMNHSLYSVFLQDEILLPRGLTVTLGTKLEHGEYNGLEVEPNVRFQWRPAPNRTVWGAISRAVRTPSRVDRDLRQAAPPNLALLNGNPEFRSEKLIAYELGYRAQKGESASTSLSAFYNDYSDIRSTSITPLTILPFYFSNNLEGHTYGFEFTADVQVTRNWTLHATYNYLEERLRVKQGEFDLSSARNETSDPQFQASLRSSLSLPGSVDLDAALRWVDTLQNNSGITPGTVSAYMDLNVRLAWRPSDELELSLVGQNLLHKQHPEYGFQGPDRREARRSLFGKLVWRH